MTHDIPPFVRSWLDDTSHEAPDAVAVNHAVFAALQRTPQQRRWLPPIGSGPTFQSTFSAAKLVVAGAIVALFAGFLIVVQPSQHQGTSVPGAPVEQSDHARCSFPDQPGIDLELGTLHGLGIGVLGFSVPTPGWALYPSNDEGWTIEKGPCVAHPGGWEVADTVITFGRPADGTYVEACGQRRGDPFAPETRDVDSGHDKRQQRAELAAAVASIAGIDVIEGPSEFDLPNGYGEVAATYVATAITEGPCRGFPHGSPLLYDLERGRVQIAAQVVPRDRRVSVWIVDYTGHAGIPDRRFWIEAETSSPEMDDEIKAIVATVQPLAG